MIYGDPSEFAIWIDEVPSWTYQVRTIGLETFTSAEGIIAIVIDGKFFTPIPGAPCSLTTHVSELKRTFKGIEIKAIEVDIQINAKKLYDSAHIPRYVGDFVSEAGMGAEIQCDLINRTNWTFYLFNCKKQERLIYSQNYGNLVYEKILLSGTVKSVLESLPEPSSFNR